MPLAPFLKNSLNQTNLDVQNPQPLGGPNNFPDYKPMKIFHMGNLAFGQKIDDITILTEQDPEYLNNCLLFIISANAIEHEGSTIIFNLSQIIRKALIISSSAIGIISSTRFCITGNVFDPI